MALGRAQAYHNLAVLLEAGVPAEKSFRTAAAGARGRLAGGFAAVADGALAGRGLAETMATHPEAFAVLDRVLVEVGETSGSLVRSLEVLSQWYAFRGRLRRIVTSGMLLPLVLLHAAAFLGPLPGVFLGGIGPGEYLLRVAVPLAALYAPAGIILAICRLTPKQGAPRRFLDGMALRIPLLGRALRQLALSRFCQAFSALCRCGVDVVQCAEMSADAAGNAAVARWARGAADSARAGNPLSEGFSGRLPSKFLDIWRVGEETGELDDAAARLARLTGEAAERTFVALGTWVPRVIYLLVCLLMAVQIVSAYGVILPRVR